VDLTRRFIEQQYAAALESWQWLGLDDGKAGLLPGTGQILSFRHPPALGGQLDVGNVEASDFVVAVDIAGQIRDQIRSLPRHQDQRRDHRRHTHVATAAVSCGPVDHASTRPALPDARS